MCLRVVLLIHLTDHIIKQQTMRKIWFGPTFCGYNERKAKMVRPRFTDEL